MGMQINTNLAANNSYRNLSNTQNDLSKSLEKLSSGLRINRAADDAAGLAISEGLKSQVNGMGVAARNAQDGISVIQTAEGSLNEVQSILQRVRDLAVQAGNDSNDFNSRKAIETEVTALTKELTRIGESTNFNGTRLLDGSSSSLSFQVGANGSDSDRITVNLNGAADVVGLANGLTVGSAGAKFDVVTPTLVTGNQVFSVTELDGSTNTVTAALAGAAGDYKTVQDVADALNASDGFKGKLSASVNKDNQMVVTALGGGSVVGGATAGTDATSGTGFGASAASTGGALDFMSKTGAAAAITTLDAAISSVSTARADLGANQNRFESVIRNLAVSKENLSAANSRIRDTDMAEEMVKFTKANILSQAGTAMLAQANQSNQGVLQLLR
jgi:flagellin